jgi:tRNA threonylcarbamoyladenosine biosynthesis protein TsaE
LIPCIQTGLCLIERRCSSPEETESLGETIAQSLKPGSVVALRGGLGAGKTCLVKGIARGLGITECITSPTYTIICEYPGNIPLYHIDAYRLNGDSDFENTGGVELMNGNGITVIEWSERIPRSVPSGAITVEIEITGPLDRIIRIQGIDLA